ncbi:Cytochrome c oxidase assembly protein COX19 [Fusarium oxysporum f. sp. raphani]|nr:Cytochrome c oxidase assembly protein COX19 [Fusarium oxysporum f. sp. raphani]RKK30894.1 hypothetical protein BFJ67_g15504 [Fusarium oxysporum f. sp. cepae]
MSTFGSPGPLPTTKPTPPQRGSFPLDHDGEWTVQNNTFNGRSLTKATAGECKTYMTKYLSCMKKVRGLNDEECRDLAKAYLSCRMDRNLMARDEFKNLGFTESPPPSAVKATLEGDKGTKD